MYTVLPASREIANQREQSRLSYAYSYSFSYLHMRKIYTSTANAKTFAKRTSRQTLSTVFIVMLLLGGVALAVSSFSGPPAGCTPASCPANPLKVIFDAANPSVEVNGTIKIKKQVAINDACSGTGLLAIDQSNGTLLFCQSGNWKSVENAWNSAAAQCTTNGWIYTGGSCQQISSFATAAAPAAPASCPAAPSGCPYGNWLPPSPHGTVIGITCDITQMRSTCINGTWINQ